jgi:hypothetical protein
MEGAAARHFTGPPIPPPPILDDDAHPHPDTVVLRCVESKTPALVFFVPETIPDIDGRCPT